MPKLFEKYQYQATTPSSIEIDVLGDEIQEIGNSCWLEFGKHLENYLKSKNCAKFTVVSTHESSYLLDNPKTSNLRTLEIDNRECKIFEEEVENLAELMSIEVFVFCENVYVFLTNVDNDQIIKVIEKYPWLDNVKFTAELLIATNDGCSLSWYNYTF